MLATGKNQGGLTRAAAKFLPRGTATVFEFLLRIERAGVVATQFRTCPVDGQCDIGRRLFAGRGGQVSDWRLGGACPGQEA